MHACMGAYPAGTIHRIAGTVHVVYKMMSGTCIMIDPLSLSIVQMDTFDVCC